MKRIILVVAFVAILASPVFSQLRLDVGVDVPMNIYAVGGGEILSSSDVGSFLKEHILPFPEASLYYQFNVGPVSLAPGVRVFSFILESVLWPNLMAELQLGPVFLQAQLGGLLFLFFGLEEISWGQRLFGWTTPRILQRSNYQGELNVHNLVNPILGRLYRWGMAAFALLTAAGWLRLSRFTETMLRFLIPHGAMAGLLLLMLLFGTIIPQQELLEQLGASFALFYALTAFRTSRRLHKVG